MKISIEFDTEQSPITAVIKVDGRRLGRVQKLALDLTSDNYGRMLIERLMPGYGGRYLNKRDIRLECKGGKWVEP